MSLTKRLNKISFRQILKNVTQLNITVHCPFKQCSTFLQFHKYFRSISFKFNFDIWPQVLNRAHVFRESCSLLINWFVVSSWGKHQLDPTIFFFCITSGKSSALTSIWWPFVAARGILAECARTRHFLCSEHQIMLTWSLQSHVGCSFHFPPACCTLITSRSAVWNPASLSLSLFLCDFTSQQQHCFSER